MTPPPSASDPLSALARARLLHGLDPHELEPLRPFVQLRAHEQDEELLEEGSSGPWMIAIVSGQVGSYRRSTIDPALDHLICWFGPEEVVGEIRLAGTDLPLPCVRAVEPTVAVWLDARAVQSHPELSGLRAKLLGRLALQLSTRLGEVTDAVAVSMDGRLEEARRRAFGGRMLLHVILLMSVYAFVLQALTVFPVARHTGLLSFGLVIASALTIYAGLAKSPYPRALFGLQLRRPLAVIGEAIALSLPIILLLTAGKWVLMQTTSLFGDHPLIDPFSDMPAEARAMSAYGTSLLAYLLHSPLQELIVRSGLQGTLLLLHPPRTTWGRWGNIVGASFIFSAFHVYMGLGYAAVAFVPGLFWGWLFARQRSLLGPVVSHWLIGVWALFVLGLQAGFR